MGDRREFLKSSIAAAGLVSPLGSALACSRPSPIADTDELWKLRFDLSSAGNRDKSVPITIDPHAHIFNAQDVQIAGYFGGPLAHEKLPAWLRPAAQALAPWIEAWARLLAPCIQSELVEIRNLARAARIRTSAEVAADFGKIFQEEVNRRRTKRESDFADHFAKEAPPAFRQLYESAVSSRDGKKQILSSKAVLAALLANGPPARRSPGSDSGGNQLDGVIAFIAGMCGPRYENAINLIETFGPAGPHNLGIDLFAPSLLDMTHWLREATTPEVQEAQVELSELIAVMCGGRIAPMVAFNPWAASLKQARDGGKKRPEDFMALVRNAVMDRGFVGVKIYPPNGYRPYGNVPRICDDPKRFYRWPDPQFGDRLNRSMKELFAFCSAEEIPVMAHNGNSMGVDDCHTNQFALPEGWGAALKLGWPKPLNAQIGHFGDEIWVQGWIDLLKDSAASKAYLDIAIETDFFTDDTVSRRMIARLEDKSVVGGEPLYTRVMYASDWFMLLYTGLTPTYLQQMDEKLFQRVQPNEARAALLGGNAVKHLGLRSGSRRRQVLDGYFRRRYTDLGEPLPDWTRTIENL
jgi:predicted TIM-barrel fold metal-dependent hydrolase